jgi:CheY-like chemotaxis protein
LTENSYNKIINIIHIDDDESFLYILKKFLNEISPKIYSITSINNSTEAFFQISSTPIYDLIISDFDMPKLNGLDLFENLVKIGIEIPCIMVSGTKMDDIPIKALNAGIKFFLRKDTDLIPLLKQLDQLIKITVKNIRAEQNLIENEKMLSDFVLILTNAVEGIDKAIYSQLIFKRILESFLSVSESDYVFLCEITFNSFKEPELFSDFLTCMDWDQENGYYYELFTEENFPFRIVKKYFKSMLTENKQMIENDLNLKINYLGKEILVTKFLGIPIFFNKKVVAIVGLINKKQEFANELIFRLHPFSLMLGTLIHLKMYILELQNQKSYLKN